VRRAVHAAVSGAVRSAVDAAVRGVNHD
jgi:hypothetical protein